MSVNLGSTSIEDAKLGGLQVEKICLGTETVWQKSTPVVIKALKFSSPNAQTLGVDSTKIGTINPSLAYSLNNGATWQTWDIANPISFGNGTDLYVRGINGVLAVGGDNYLHFQFSTSSPVACSGNVMHLFDYTQDLLAFDPSISNRGLKNLFSNCTVLTTPPDLPATGLAYAYTYQRMFYNCTSLVTTPALPALQLHTNDYRNMFDGCSNLEKIPALPAQSIMNVSDCYRDMFKNCSKIKMSLTQTDEYPNEFRITASSPANPAYYSDGMFAYTGGTYAPLHGVESDVLYTANEVIN